MDLDTHPWGAESCTRHGGRDQRVITGVSPHPGTSEHTDTLASLQCDSHPCILKVCDSHSCASEYTYTRILTLCLSPLYLITRTPLYPLRYDSHPYPYYVYLHPLSNQRHCTHPCTFNGMTPLSLCTYIQHTLHSCTYTHTHTPLHPYYISPTLAITHIIAFLNRHVQLLE